MKSNLLQRIIDQRQRLENIHFYELLVPKMEGSDLIEIVSTIELLKEVEELLK
jgi:hypothetical protein